MARPILRDDLDRFCLRQRRRVRERTQRIVNRLSTADDLVQPSLDTYALGRLDGRRTCVRRRLDQTEGEAQE